MVVIIKNLSKITAGSPMVWIPINLVQRPISPGLIKDLWIQPLQYTSQETLRNLWIVRVDNPQFFVASSRIFVESSKGVCRIVKGRLRICRRASAQSQLSKASAKSYCIPRIVEG